MTAEAAAWILSPADHLAARPAAHAVPARPISVYVPMRDGCRLALDVHLPDGDAATPRPALALFTPYYRRFALVEGSKSEPNPNSSKFRDFFTARGYVVVIVDVRGTGASFGTRDGFRSPAERLDSAEIVDWMIEQPWSNGRVGATGISYLGAASDFLASTGHPAVKAIAPLFSVWDTWTDNYFPGGLQCASLTATYDRLAAALDQDRRAGLAEFKYYADPDFCGPQPVDEDPDGALLARAVAEHRGNFRQTEFMADLRWREEGLPYDPAYSSAVFSPYHYAGGVREDLAILSVSGWMDGAGYANGAIARFLNLPGPNRHLMLGPWDHGARIDVSPWRAEEAPAFPWMGEVLRFFDHYLAEVPNGYDAEAPVHYYALHEEAWRAADQWPPLPGTLALHPGEAGLATAPRTGTATHAVDPTLGAGRQTRYERIAGHDSRDYYCDWQGRTDRMLSWDSAPLGQAMDLAGHATLELTLSMDAPDAALFAYLTEVEADGTERYVTEGLLRALHREEATPPERLAASWPWRPFRRETARPMIPGAATTMRIPFLPTAWTLFPGSRLRLSIAGADADHFGKIPHGKPPALSVDLARTRLLLPVEGAPAGDPLTAALEFLASAAGAKAATALAYEGAGARRVGSTDPAMPRGGFKRMVDAPAMGRMRAERRVQVFEGDAMRAIFAERDAIERLGCGAVLNLPVRDANGIAGQINLLAPAGGFAGADMDALEKAADRAAPLVRAALAAWQGDRAA